MCASVQLSSPLLSSPLLSTPLHSYSTPTLPYPTLPYPTLPYPTLPYPFLSYAIPTLSHPALLYDPTSNRITIPVHGAREIVRRSVSCSFVQMPMAVEPSLMASMAYSTSSQPAGQLPEAPV